MTFQPLTNYAGYEHVLNALPCFVHPNGNLYGIAIEKQSGVRQNLSVYRVRPGSAVRELVKRYVGGIDSAAQIAAGGCVIHPDGSLEVWASAVPVGVPPITKTGFVGGYWPRVPDVDEPYTFGGGGGGGGITLLPQMHGSPAWEGRTMSGGILVDIPATFNVPSAPCYLVRLVGIGPTDTRFRAGTEASPHYFTINTKSPTLQEMDQGWVPGPVCYVSVVDKTGQPVEGMIWLAVAGYSG